MYQTDFSGITKDDGCLVFSIYDMCRDAVTRMGHEPRDVSIKEMKEILKHAHAQGCIQKGPDDSSFGMYVLDHEKLADEFLSFLIQPYIRCSYIAAEYMPSENRDNWGKPSRNNGIIIQVTTRRGNGHFRRLDYDPWYDDTMPDKGAGIDRIRSVRYYRFKEV